MPIQFTRAYQTSDGQTHVTLEAAQKAEIKALAAEHNPGSMTCQDWLDLLVGHRAEVLAILSQKERQRVRAAKPSSRGVSKKRNGRASSLGATLPPSKESAADAPPLFGKDAA